MFIKLCVCIYYVSCVYACIYSIINVTHTFFNNTSYHLPIYSHLPIFVPTFFFSSSSVQTSKLTPDQKDHTRSTVYYRRVIEWRLTFTRILPNKKVINQRIPKTYYSKLLKVNFGEKNHEDEANSEQETKRKQEKY